MCRLVQTNIILYDIIILIIVRLFTIVVEVFDMTILTGYTIGLILNSVIVIQILYYGDKSKKTD